MKRAALLVVFSVSCSGGGRSPAPGTGPATVVQPTPTPPPTTAPIACEPWPDQLATQLAKLPIPGGVCLKSSSEMAPSDYSAATRIVTLRPDGNPNGSIATLGHELGHAHQHWAVLNSGIADIGREPDVGAWMVGNWLQTAEGKEYVDRGGWVFTGFGRDCTRYPSAACWSQDVSYCESSYCHTVNGVNGGGYTNPVEENAEFIAEWYNAAQRPNWGIDNLTRVAPKRAGWARVWLP